MEAVVENRLAKYASIQSMAEIGVGSVVHSLHLPMGGHFLSLNQVICLGLTTRRSSRRKAVSEALGVSTIAALLKVLSPAGKRVLPMLAIGMQGALFATGLGLAGANVVGAILGAMLLSVWGFVQPLGTAYVLFGTTFFEAAESLWRDFSAQLGIDVRLGIWIVVSVVALKGMAAAVVAVLSWRAPDGFEAHYLARVDDWWKRARGMARKKRGSIFAEGGPRPEPSRNDRFALLNSAIGATTDLLNPLFLGSLLLCMIFLKSEGWEFALRTLLLTYLLFFAIRAVPVKWVERALARFPVLDRAVRDLRATSHPRGRIE